MAVALTVERHPHNESENDSTSDEADRHSSHPPPPDLRLFGLDLVRLSPLEHLLVGSIGVFVCYLVYGILQVSRRM